MLIVCKQASKQTILSASIASRVYPNQQFVGTIGAIGQDSGQGREYRECPDQIGTVGNYGFTKSFDNVDNGIFFVYKFCCP